MSTAKDRAHRCLHRILPIKVRVRQKDGSFIIQVVDSDARIRKPSRPCKAARSLV